MTSFTTNYAPNALGEVVYPDDQTREDILEFEKGRFHHVVLYGTYGNGKSTIAKLLPSAVAPDVHWGSDVHFMNGSLLNGIGQIRKLSDTLNYRTFNCRGANFVIIDEADQLTQAAWLSLKGLLDEFKETAMFIFTTNYIQKVDGGVLSRSLRFQFDPPSSERLVPLIEKVLDAEGLTMEHDEMERFARRHGKSVRNLLTELENLVLRQRRQNPANSTSVATPSNAPTAQPPVIQPVPSNVGPGNTPSCNTTTPQTPQPSEAA